VVGSLNLEQLAMLPKEDSDYTGNTLDQLEVTDTSITSPYILRNLGVATFFQQGVRIGGTDEVLAFFSVEPGSTLLFKSGQGLRVNGFGALSAVGTADDPIVFAPQEEDGPGSWLGIELYGDQDGLSTLQFVDVGYAGSVRAAINISSGDPLVTDSSVHHSGCYGVLVSRPEEGAVVSNISYEENVCGDYSNTFP
jgi:hypothetical protein